MGIQIHQWTNQTFSYASFCLLLLSFPQAGHKWDLKKKNLHLVRLSISAGMLFNLFPPMDRDCSRLSSRNCFGISRNRFPLKFSVWMGIEPNRFGNESSSSWLFFATSVFSWVSCRISSGKTLSVLLLMSRYSRLENMQRDVGKNARLLYVSWSSWICLRCGSVMCSRFKSASCRPERFKTRVPSLTLGKDSITPSANK